MSDPAAPAVPDSEFAWTADRQRRIRLWGGVLALLAVGGWVGVLGFGYLVTEQPLVLIALSPLLRHMVLVAPKVAAWAFLSVAMTRLLLSCAAGFQFGLAVGGEALVWLDQNSPQASRFVRWAERLFARSPWLAILALPGLVVAMLAAISGMRRATLLAIASVGLLLRLSLVLLLGRWLLEPIDWVLEQIAQHRLEVTLAIVVMFGIYQWRNRARPSYRTEMPDGPPEASGRGTSPGGGPESVRGLSSGR